MRLITRARLHDLFLVLAMASAASMTAVSLAIGLSLFVVGLGFQTWSKAALVRDRHLSSTGPYAICRHPFYLANAIFDMGLAAMSGNYWLLLLYPPVFYMGYMPTIRKEEAKLEAIFGRDACAEYRGTTGAILPRSLRVLRHWRAPLSLSNLLVERQISRIVRYLALPLAVLLAHRLWTDPLNPLSEANLALAAGIAALNLVAFVIFRTVEKKVRTSLFSRGVLRLARHAVAGGALVFPVAAIAGGWQPSDVLLGVVFPGAWAGLAITVEAFGAGRRRGRVFSAAAGHCGMMLLAGVVLGQLDALWLLPAILSLALCQWLVLSTGHDGHEWSPPEGP